MNGEYWWHMGSRAEPKITVRGRELALGLALGGCWGEGGPASPSSGWVPRRLQSLAARDGSLRPKLVVAAT